MEEGGRGTVDHPEEVTGGTDGWLRCGQEGHNSHY